jgi:hypothetical protein
MTKHSILIPYRAAVFAWLAGLAVPAAAAPFCVESMALPPQCLYFDAASCQQRAGQLGGNCIANPDELTVRGEQGRYCVVSSTHAVSCIYEDQGACMTEAKHEQSVCVEAQGRPEAPGIDPYRDIRPGMTGSVATH